MDAKITADLKTAADAYLAALRKAAEESGIPMLARMADDFEKQHAEWVPKRLASAADKT